jgi:DNA-binding SARP family transcriptional activator
VIRANQALNDVVSDLAQLAEHHKNRPAVYRVLGDGLMRQGNLQAALDTYRKALNQL